MTNPKQTIVVVDDVMENIQVLSGILQKEGYNLAFARNGKQALSTIKKTKPDLVLMDISMPKMDGFEVCRHLKSDDETKNIPLIFLTARTQTEEIIKGFDLGAVDYVTKPFNKKELLLRVRTHLQLQRALKDLIELNAAKDKFFRIIGHDMKSPIAQMIQLAEMIENNISDFDEDKLLYFVRAMKKSSLRGFKLLENLLDWARSQTGGISFNPEPFSISEIINETLQLLEKQAETKKITIVTLSLYDGLITADRNMISTIVRNLLSNAIKFTHPDGIIEINTKIDQGNLTVSIKDNGVGMSSESCTKLFKIYSGFTSIGTNKEKGTGIGLILCKEFIDKHNGKIWVESEIENGSIFSFMIPVSGA